MIPMLFDAINNSYVDIINAATGIYSQSLGYIDKINCTSCQVTETRNGEYNLQLEYPLQDTLINHLIPGNLILAKVPGCYYTNEATGRDWYSMQFFKINKIERKMETLSVEAHHISYELSYKPVQEFEPENNVPVGWYLRALLDATPNNPFEISSLGTWTDNISYKYQGPASLKKYLGGMKGSFLDIAGGEYYWDNLKAYVCKNRGRNIKYRIKYGRNMSDFKQEASDDDTFSAALAYAEKDGISVSALATTSTPNDLTRYAVLDFSEDYIEGDLPTEEELRQRALDYINNNNTNQLKVSLDINYLLSGRLVDELNIKEYIRLCDTVSINFEKYNLEVDLKVVKVVYDVLGERNISIELNQPKKTLADTIATLQIETDSLSGLSTAAAANRVAAQAANILLGQSTD